MKTLFLQFFFFLFCNYCFTQRFEMGLSLNGGFSKFTGDTQDDEKYNEGSSWEKSGSVGLLCNFRIKGNFWFNSGLFIDKIQGTRSSSYSFENLVYTSENNQTISAGYLTINELRQRTFHAHYISIPMTVGYDLEKINFHAGLKFMFHHYSYRKYDFFDQLTFDPSPPFQDSTLIGPTSTQIVAEGINDKTRMKDVLLLFNVGASFNILKQAEITLNLYRSTEDVFSGGSSSGLKLVQGTVGINYFMTNNHH